VLVVYNFLLNIFDFNIRYLSNIMSNIIMNYLCIPINIYAIIYIIYLYEYIYISNVHYNHRSWSLVFFLSLFCPFQTKHVETTSLHVAMENVFKRFGCAIETTTVKTAQMNSTALTSHALNPNSHASKTTLA